MTVTNPPDFRGFPEHDKTDPAFDLALRGIDPERYFVHFEAEHPLVVEHRTGFPKYKIVNGKLVPYAPNG